MCVHTMHHTMECEGRETSVSPVIKLNIQITLTVDTSSTRENNAQQQENYTGREPSSSQTQYPGSPWAKELKTPQPTLNTAKTWQHRLAIAVSPTHEWTAPSNTETHQQSKKKKAGGQTNQKKNYGTKNPNGCSGITMESEHSNRSWNPHQRKDPHPRFTYI